MNFGVDQRWSALVGFLSKAIVEIAQVLQLRSGDRGLPPRRRHSARESSQRGVQLEAHGSGQFDPWSCAEEHSGKIVGSGRFDTRSSKPAAATEFAASALTLH